ncbi:MAG: hypothetical protein KDA17_07045 [Candidatus Saccharibacteria bacterium]|nr:hypothetical protein [Candidatus Saccharibacteria bacterium]
MNLILIALLFIAQSNYPTPDFPDIPTATPFGTPVPGEEHSNPLDPETMQENVERSQSGVIELATSAAIYNNQLYIDGSPVLPDTSGAVTSWSYFKFMTSSAGYSLFGAFSPVMAHIAIILSIAMVSLTVYALVRVAAFLFEVVSALVNWILKLWGALPFT